MNKKEKLAYLAGLIDGEGNIRIENLIIPKKYIRVKKKGYSITNYYRQSGRLVIANTDKRVIDWCKDNFGGFIYEKKMKEVDKLKGWKNCYQWIKMLNSPSLELVKDVIPYLIIKKERMKILLDFLKTKSKPGILISEKIRKERINLIEKLNKLNKRGI